MKLPAAALFINIVLTTANSSAATFPSCQSINTGYHLPQASMAICRGVLAMKTMAASCCQSEHFQVLSEALTEIPYGHSWLLEQTAGGQRFRELDDFDQVVSEVVLPLSPSDSAPESRRCRQAALAAKLLDEAALQSLIASQAADDSVPLVANAEALADIPESDTALQGSSGAFYYPLSDNGGLLKAEEGGAECLLSLTTTGESADDLAASQANESEAEAEEVVNQIFSNAEPAALELGDQVQLLMMSFGNGPDDDSNGGVTLGAVINQQRRAGVFLEAGGLSEPDTSIIYIPEKLRILTAGNKRSGKSKSGSSGRPAQSESAWRSHGTGGGGEGADNHGIGDSDDDESGDDEEEDDSSKSDDSDQDENTELLNKSDLQNLKHLAQQSRSVARVFHRRVTEDPGELHENIEDDHSRENQIDEAVDEDVVVKRVSQTAPEEPEQKDQSEVSPDFDELARKIATGERRRSTAVLEVLQQARHKFQLFQDSQDLSDYTPAELETHFESLTTEQLEEKLIQFERLVGQYEKMVSSLGELEQSRTETYQAYLDASNSLESMKKSILHLPSQEKLEAHYRKMNTYMNQFTWKNELYAAYHGLTWGVLQPLRRLTGSYRSSIHEVHKARVHERAEQRWRRAGKKAVVVNRLKLAKKTGASYHHEDFVLKHSLMGGLLHSGGQYLVYSLLAAPFLAAYGLFQYLYTD